MTPIEFENGISIPNEVITSLVEVLPKTDVEFASFLDTHVKVNDIDFTKLDVIKTKEFSSIFLSEVLGITSFIVGKDIFDVTILEEAYIGGVESFFKNFVNTPVSDVEVVRIDNEKIVLDFITNILPTEEISIDVVKDVFVSLGLLVSIYSTLVFSTHDINIIESLSIGIFGITKFGTPTVIPEVVVPETSVKIFQELALVIGKIDTQI